MPDHWGMHGFQRGPKLRTVHTPVNVGALEELAAGASSLDLNALGYDKLLGSGRISSAITVTVAHASEGAVAKVEAAGGSVVLEEGGDAWGEWEEE